MATQLTEWINGLGLHAWVQETEWVVPTTQSIHILAVSAVFASSMVLALRSWKLAGVDWPAARWVHRLGGWIWGALFVLLVSGALLIVGEPGRTLTNWSFRLKIVLLLVAIACAVPLLRRLDSGSEPAGAERALAAVLVLLWAAIIVAGRWIAYA